MTKTKGIVEEHGACVLDLSHEIEAPSATGTAPATGSATHPTLVRSRRALRFFHLRFSFRDPSDVFGPPFVGVRPSLGCDSARSASGTSPRPW